MSAKLIFGPRSRRRVFAVRLLRVHQGALARGPLLGLYQAKSGEAAVRAARHDFPKHAGEVLAAIDQVGSLQVLGGEAPVFLATIQCPDGSCHTAILNHDRPEQAFRRIRVSPRFAVDSHCVLQANRT
jgi:hypothetical protein